MLFHPLIIAACVGLLSQPAPAPTFQTDLQAFQQERTETAQRFPDSALQAADDLIKRAKTTQANGNEALARTLIRNARWHLPYVPIGMPKHVVRMLGQGRFRHGDRVNAIAFRPDGRRIVTASRDGTARVWNLDNGRETVIYREHGNDSSSEEQTDVFSIPMVAYSPDGKMIASSGAHDIHLWDAETGKQLKTLVGHQQLIRGLAFTPDGKKLISGSDDRRIILWNVADGKSRMFPPQDQGIAEIAVNPSGKSFVSINRAGQLLIYSLDEKTTEPIVKIATVQGSSAGFSVAYLDENRLLYTTANRVTLQEVPKSKGNRTPSKILRVCQVSRKKINTLATVPGAKQFLVGGDDFTVQIWDVATGTRTRTFDTHQEKVTAVAVSPDGSFAVSADERGQMRILRLTDAEEPRINADAQAELWSVAHSPKETLYAAAGSDNTIRVYDSVSGTLKQTLTGHRNTVTALAFLSENRLASTAGDKLLKLWDLTTGQAIDGVGHSNAVLTVATTPDALSLVTGSFDRSVRGWNPETGALLWTWKGDSVVCSVALSKDGRTAYVGCADGQLQVVTIPETGSPTTRSRRSAHINGVADIALSPDGNRLASCGGDGTVIVWNRLTEALVEVNRIVPRSDDGDKPRPITTVDYSDDSKYLMFGGASTKLSVWDAVEFTEVRIFDKPTGWITSAQFGRNAGVLYTVGVDKIVRRFEMSFETARSSLGHTMAVYGIAISPDRKRIATASADRTIKIWNLDTGKLEQTLVGSEDEVHVVRFLDNDQLASNATDMKLRIWSLATGQTVRSATTGNVFVIGANPDSSKVSLIHNVKDQSNAYTVFIETYSTADMKRELIIEKNRDINCGNFSPDMSLAVTGDPSGIVRVWNVATKNKVGGDWALFDQACGDIGITPDNKTLISMNIQGIIKIADIAERAAGKAFSALPGNPNPIIAGLVVSPDGKRFCTFFGGGEVVLWSIDGKKLRDWKLPVAPTALAFVPDSNQIVTGNKDGTIMILETPR